MQIVHQMWGGAQVAPYAGRHYQLAEPISRPRPIQRPHPPIVVGGRGERKTLRLVARYGDACNFSMFHHAPDLSAPAAINEVRHKLDVLKAHCETVGRPYDEIQRTVLGWLPVGGAALPGALTPARAQATLQAYADLGVGEVMIATSTLFPDGPDLATFALLAREVIPAASEITPRA